MWASFEGKTNSTYIDHQRNIDPCDNEFGKPLELLPDLGMPLSPLA